MPHPFASKYALSSHADLVGVLFIIWGVLTALVGASTLALGVGAVALINSASRGGSFARRHTTTPPTAATR